MIRLIAGTGRELVVKGKLSPRGGSAALRHLTSSIKKTKVLGKKGNKSKFWSLIVSINRG